MREMDMWNFRVLRQTVNDLPIYSVHEVYYNKGVPVAYTLEPTILSSVDLEELLVDIENIAQDIRNNKVLDESEVDTSQSLCSDESDLVDL